MHMHTYDINVYYKYIHSYLLVSCDPSTTEDMCSYVFANGKCEEQCNTEDQLFDGGDCDPYRDEICSANTCRSSYNDGNCDRNCSSSQVSCLLVE